MNVYVVGTLRKNAKGIFELTNVGIYSEDPWRLTQQHGGELLLVAMSPAIEGKNFTEAQKNAQEFAENAYRNLDPQHFEWKQ